MKIAQINTVCGNGSVGRITVDIYHALKKSGHDGKIFIYTSNIAINKSYFRKKVEYLKKLGYNDYKALYSMGVNLVFLNEPLINTSVFENLHASGHPSKQELRIMLKYNRFL